MTLDCRLVRSNAKLLTLTMCRLSMALLQCECVTVNVMNLMVVNVVYFCDA